MPVCPVLHDPPLAHRAKIACATGCQAQESHHCANDRRERNQGHQRANAEILARAGAARLIEDDAFDAEALLDAASILDDPTTHAGMSAAARELARPNAADAVARLVVAAAERRPLPDPADIERRSREPVS